MLPRASCLLCVFAGLITVMVDYHTEHRSGGCGDQVALQVKDVSFLGEFLGEIFHSIELDHLH